MHLYVTQSSEVGSTNACEIEGLRRSMAFLLDEKDLPIPSLVTDRHISVNKNIREVVALNPNAQGMSHIYDVWHVAKGKNKCFF